MYVFLLFFFLIVAIACISYQNRVVWLLSFRIRRHVSHLLDCAMKCLFDCFDFSIKKKEKFFKGQKRPYFQFRDGRRSIKETNWIENNMNLKWSFFLVILRFHFINGWLWEDIFVGWSVGCVFVSGFWAAAPKGAMSCRTPGGGLSVCPYVRPSPPQALT